MNYEKENNAKAFLKIGLFYGLSFCLFFGTYIYFVDGFQAALICGPICGLLFGLIIGLIFFFFSKSKKVNEQTKLEGVDESDIVYAGAANYYQKKMAIGGKLYLLNNQLVFKAHSFNLPNNTHSVEISNINELVFFNPLGIVKNGLQITLKDGTIEKFVVNNRDIWKQYIEQLIK